MRNLNISTSALQNASRNTTRGARNGKRNDASTCAVTVGDEILVSEKEAEITLATVLRSRDRPRLLPLIAVTGKLK